MNKNCKWPGPRIGSKVTLFHLSVPSGSRQPVLTPPKCTRIHPTHTPLCLAKCIAKAQLYFLSHPMSNQAWQEENDSKPAEFFCDPYWSLLVHTPVSAQHRPTHRRRSINIHGIESLLISLKYDVSLSLIHIRKENRENTQCTRHLYSSSLLPTTTFSGRVVFPVCKPENWGSYGALTC